MPTCRRCQQDPCRPRSGVVRRADRTDAVMPFDVDGSNLSGTHPVKAGVRRPTAGLRSLSGRCWKFLKGTEVVPKVLNAWSPVWGRSLIVYVPPPKTVQPVAPN